MSLTKTSKPIWLTFDCYGTLIQWDEGLQSAAAEAMKQHAGVGDPAKIVEPYDLHESDLERCDPLKRFRDVAAAAFSAALRDLGIEANTADGDLLTASIPSFAPFPETLDTLAALKSAGFRIALISNTDDDLVAGNVAKLGGHIDAVVTAQQARAYKPSPKIFEHALAELGIGYDGLVHICASPALDHVAARDQHFRCIWIDRGTYRVPLDDYAADETFPSLSGLTGLFARLGWMR